MGLFSRHKNRQVSVRGASGLGSSEASGRKKKFFSPFALQILASTVKDEEPQVSADAAPAPAPSKTASVSPLLAAAQVAPAQRAVVHLDQTPPVEEVKSVTNGDCLAVDTVTIVTATESSAIEEAASAPAAAQANSSVLTSAYKKAWESLSADDRQDLTLDDGLRRLLQQLSARDEEDQKQSLLRRGIQALTPYLGPLKTTMDFVGTFASAEPIAGTAIGIVKSVASGGIGISGAAQDLDLTLLIGGVLELLPVMERCDKVVGEGKEMGPLHDALCDVYKDLLDFHLKATRLLKRSNFIVRMALNMLKPALPDILASFNKHALVLSRLVDVETFAAVQDIKNEQIETLVRDTLDVNRGNEIAYHNELKQRADEACQWITSVDAFKYWQLSLDNTSVLAMFGDMGCGKTMTTAYVVDYLSVRKSTVCSYYCKSDQQTTSLGNIYRSLVWQLLKRRPGLRQKYWKWYRDTEPVSQVSPAQSESHLQEFLVQAISSSEEWTFVVLDGLDELETAAQKQLLGVLRRLVDGHGRLKVFVSSRYYDDIASALPTGYTRIDVPSSAERDQLIAGFLIDSISSISHDTKDQVVSELSAKAGGSAIWLRIAVEYLEKVRIKTPKGVQSHLERLPTSKGLTELYWKLFDKICGGIPKNEDRVRRALEMLAVAQRPLTPTELSYAVLFDPDENEPITTVTELTEVVAEVDLLELIRPFVSVFAGDVDTGSSRQLRLVHQSVKEIILQGSPDEWQTLGKLKSVGRNTKRYGAMNGLLLRQCVKYLLLEECGTSELPLGSGFGVENANDLDFLQMDMFDDAEDDLKTEKQPGKADKYDPEEFGFGGFFVYAAVYWTAHFGATEAYPEYRPDPQDLAALCAKGSRRLANWAEQCLRPRCTYQMEARMGEELADMDPVVVAAMFGPAESVIDMVRRDTDAASIWRAVGRLVRAGKTKALRQLVGDETSGRMLCTPVFFDRVLLNWSTYGADDVQSTQDWMVIFEFVIVNTRDRLLDEGSRVLTMAAGAGCLPLVKALFKVADDDPELRASILSVDRRPRPGLREKHQSVGEAAYELPRTEVLRFLCTQPGIEPHLFYVDDNGRTVYHQAARRGHAEVFRVLIERWPEGLNQTDNNGDSPLEEVVYNNQRGDRDTTQTIKDILATGAADVKGHREEAGKQVLVYAVRQGNMELCRVLIVDGSADLACVVEVDTETGKPALKPAVVGSQTTGVDGEKTLKELCSLLPLAVSTEDLF